MHYLVHEHFSATIRGWMASPRGAALAGRIEVIDYAELFRRGSLPRGAYVFADLEIATPATLRLAGAVHDQLAAAGPGVRLLNDPRRVLRRYDLLAAAHAAGLNEHRARRLDEPLHDLRYPVFLREEAEHSGGLTGLLGDARALRRAIRRLTSPLHGYARRELLVVEFTDTSRDGRFDGYSAFRVGDRILARWLMVTRHWVGKARHRVLDEAALLAQQRFVTTNPHAEWLREVFDLAGIGYGRADYGLLDGRPQLWEINTNPTVGARRSRPNRPAIHEAVPPDLRPILMATMPHFDDAYREAVFALDRDLPPGPPVEIRLDEAEIRAMEAEQRVFNRRRKRRRRLRRLRRVAGALVPGRAAAP